MPKTEHYQWYVEQFSDTELHHHAIDELYYSGRTPFQVGGGAAHGRVRQDAGARRRHAEFASRREDLPRVARASGAGGVRRARRGADPRRRRGRDAARSVAPSRRRALHDGRHRRRGRRVVQEILARVVGRRVRGSAREPDHRRRAGVHQAARHVRCDRFGSDRAAARLAVVSALQRRGLSRHQGAAGAGRRLRAASEHRRLSQHGAARQDGALAARAFPPRIELLHARAGVRQRLGVHRLQRRARRRRARHRNGSTPTSRNCAARTTSTMPKRTAASSACRSTCAANSPRPATSSHERPRRAAAPDGALRRAPGAGRADRAVRRLRDAGAVRRHSGRARRGAQARGLVRSLAHGAVRAARRRRCGLGRHAHRQPRRDDEAAASALQRLHQRRRRRARRRDLLPACRIAGS